MDGAIRWCRLCDPLKRAYALFFFDLNQSQKYIIVMNANQYQLGVYYANTLRSFRYIEFRIFS